MSEEISQTHAENPETFTGEIKIKEPYTVAGGVAAVYHSAQHILGEMNAGRGMKALLALNQKGEFDCP